MKEYTENEIVNMIHGDPEINVIAIATTPWHALGVDAVLLHLQEQGIHLKGYIIIRPHMVTGVGLTEDNFMMRKKGDLQVIISKLYWEPKSIKEKIAGKKKQYQYYKRDLERNPNNTLYWIRPVNPSYDIYPMIDTAEYDHQVKTILIDEGMGTYLNGKKIWIQVAFEEGGWKRGIRSIIETFIAEGFFLPGLYRRGQVQKYYLMRRERRAWIEDKEVAASYRKILEMNDQQDNYQMYERAAVFNTGPYETIMKDDEDLKVLKRVSEILQKNQIPIVVKPHPREMGIEKYQVLGGWLESRKRVAQENILASLGQLPRYIIGFESTTLVTGYILFGVKAISLNRLISPDKLYHRNWFQRFNRAFGKVIFTPNSYEELADYIEKAEETYERN